MKHKTETELLVVTLIAENPEIRGMWENIAKKYNGLGLAGISMACGGLAMVISSPSESLLQCALYVLC